MHPTAPDQALEFAQKTGVNALTVAIGVSHETHKFTKEPDREILAMRTVVKARTQEFAQAGHAADYDPIAPEEMASR